MIALGTFVEHAPITMPDPNDLSLQLHGVEFDLAGQQIKNLEGRRLTIMRLLCDVDSSLRAAGSVEIPTAKLFTEEGIVEYQPTITPITPGRNMWLRNQQRNSLAYDLNHFGAKINNLKAVRWQEAGKRLFRLWREDTLTGVLALAAHHDFTLYPTPPDYFEPCDTSRDEVIDLYQGTLTSVSEQLGGDFDGIDFPMRSTVPRNSISEAAKTLGIDITDYGL